MLSQHEAHPAAVDVITAPDLTMIVRWSHKKQRLAEAGATVATVHQLPHGLHRPVETATHKRHSPVRFFSRKKALLQTGVF